MKMTRECRDARRAQIAAMVRDGSSAIEVAHRLGVDRKTVYLACYRLGVRTPVRAPTLPAAVAVRSVHESMDEPEWSGLCLHHRALSDACLQVAKWRRGQCLACDEHKRALACNVSIRRVRAEEAEAWFA